MMPENFENPPENFEEIDLGEKQENIQNKIREIGQLGSHSNLATFVKACEQLLSSENSSEVLNELSKTYAEPINSAERKIIAMGSAGAIFRYYLKLEQPEDTVFCLLWAHAITNLPLAWDPGSTGQTLRNEAALYIKMDEKKKSHHAKRIGKTIKKYEKNKNP